MDGIRALARIDGTAELFSRQATRLSSCFPEITDGLVEAPAGRNTILDGEIVALDQHARPSFELIQRCIPNTRPPARLLATVPVMFDVVREIGLEGVVCKRATSVYQPGRRSGAWIKSVVRYRSAMAVGDGCPAERAGSDRCLSAVTTMPVLWCISERSVLGSARKMRETLAENFVEVSCERSPSDGLEAVDGVRWLIPSVVVNVDCREFNGRLRHPSLKGLAEVEPHLVELPKSGL
jgi:bifunctional non-homologous end joining protein LigD